MRYKRFVGKVKISIKLRKFYSHYESDLRIWFFNSSVFQWHSLKWLIAILNDWRGLTTLKKKKHFGKITQLNFFSKIREFSKWTAKAHVVLISLAFFSLNKRYNVKIMHLFANFFYENEFKGLSLLSACNFIDLCIFSSLKKRKNIVKLKNSIKFCIWVGSKRAYTDLKTKLQKLT